METYIVANLLTKYFYNLHEYDRRNTASVSELVDPYTLQYKFVLWAISYDVIWAKAWEGWVYKAKTMAQIKQPY